MKLINSNTIFKHYDFEVVHSTDLPSPFSIIEITDLAIREFVKFKTENRKEFEESKLDKHFLSFNYKFRKYFFEKYPALL